MAKREFIDKKEVLDMKKSYCIDDYDMYTPLVVDVDDIEEMPTFTEQEIVKPYLDRLRAEVEMRLSLMMFDQYGNETPEHKEFICILDEILKGELQKQTTDNCDNCFNGTTKGGCAVKELMKNKDCKYYMPKHTSNSDSKEIIQEKSIY